MPQQIESTPSAQFGKKKHINFPLAATLEKHDRIARQSIHDLLLFNQVLEAEMRRIVSKREAVSLFDREIFDRMVKVKEQYQNAMNVLKDKEGDRQRHALIVFADAVKDLMTYIHCQRRH